MDGDIMTFEQLQYFYTAATLSHIGRAAEQEKISQPSLSIAIKKLEKELNVPLFRKNGRNVELTEQGKQFLPYASSILQQAAQAKAQMAQCSSQFHCKIRLGYTASVACRFIPELISDFLADGKHNYLIYSDEMPSDEIEKGLEDGRFDLGICSRLEDKPDIVQIPIIHQPLVLILPEEGPSFLTDLPDPSPDVLSRLPFVSYRQDYPMYRQISGLFRAKNLSPQITHYAYSEDAIARLVEHGLGISIVAQTETLDTYRVRILRPAWLTAARDIFLTWHRFRYHGTAVDEMIDFILSRQKEDANAEPLKTQIPEPF